MPCLGAERHRQRFLNFLKIKCRKICFTFFSEILRFRAHVLMFCIVLTGKDGKRKNYACTGLGHSIPYKIMFVSTI